MQDGINSGKSSLPVNDNNGNQQTENNSPDGSTLKGKYRPASKKPGKKDPVKKTADRSPEDNKQLGDETDISDETTI